MKKTNIALAFLFGALSIAAIAQNIADVGMYNASAAGPATAYIKPQAGRIELLNLSASATGTVTVTKYFASVQMATAAAGNSSNVLIVTDSAGKVSGQTPATADFVILSASNGWVLKDIDTIASPATNSGVVSSTFTVAGGDFGFASGVPAFLVKAADVVAANQGAATVANALYQGVGYPGAPVAITADGGAAGATTVGGMYQVRR